jgi:hypothetical protein
MFCPNCGKADQTENTYCRSCGEFLPDLSKKSKIAFGGNTPEEQINANLFLNLLSAIVSLILGIALYWTIWDKGDASPIIYIVAAFLLAMSGWQFSTFAVGLKLKKTFRKRKSNTEKEESSNEKTFAAAKTKELLNEADFSDVVSVSVTENTTKHLAEKIKRSSQTEK